MKHTDPKILTVWRIRAVLAMLLPSFFTSLFFRGIPWLRWGLTALWMAVAVFLVLIYLPRKYRNTTYRMDNSSLVVTSGVFYTTMRSIPTQNVQFVSVNATPLQAIMGTPSLVVRSAGGILIIPGVTPKEAATLRAQLIQNGEGSADD